MQGGSSPPSSNPAGPDWRLVGIASCGLFGVQIVWGLQNVSTSRIFQTLGADVADLPLLWIAGPITGLLVQPLVGYFSDRSRSRFGRRRPFLLVGTLLTVVGMLALGNASTLTGAVLALWLLTASVNIAMQPLRAHLADLVPKEQRGMGYALQVAFIGSGAVLASALPWLLKSAGVDGVGVSGQLPATVSASFLVGAFLLLASVAVTLRSPDRPLEDPVQLDELDGRRPPVVKRWLPEALMLAALGLGLAAAALNLRHEIYLLAATLLAFGVALWRLETARRSGVEKVHGLLEIVADFVDMPPVMRALGWVQFCTWFGLFAFWVYAVPAVAARDGVVGAAGYNDSADRVGLLFATFDATALLVAFLLPSLIRRIGIAASHIACLTIGSFGLLLFASSTEPASSWAASIAIGIAWASILSAPYAIVANAVPASRVGTYMGIHNVFLVLPQLVAATTLGAIVDATGAGPVAMLWLAGASLLVGATLSPRLR